MASREDDWGKGDLVFGQCWRWNQNGYCRGKDDGSCTYRHYTPEQRKEVLDESEARKAANAAIDAADAAKRAAIKTLECGICMDEISKLAALTCGHMFCRPCIDRSFATRPVRFVGGAVGGSCPICRRYTTTNQIRNCFAPRVGNA